MNMQKSESVVANNGNIKQLVEDGIEKNGINANLDYIDVSKVYNMYKMFSDSNFNGDISKCDVSKV